MFDMLDRDNLIETRVNFWPCLVDAISCVLILMFLLYIMKGVASGEMEAIRARQAMSKLQRVIEQKFREAGLGDVVHCQYSTNILRISFSDAVLFDTGQYRMHPRGRRALQVSAQALQLPSGPHFAQIQVEGHTDSVPLTAKDYPHDNWELSSARAVSVLKELVSMGVRPEVISANGYADQIKIDNGSGPAADKRNRRIELRIVYSIPKPVVAKQR
jgi:flagellar motor protein MotB